MGVAMRFIRVATLEHCDLQHLTAIWNRCWRGYYYDMTYTVDHMRAWLTLGQVALQHSVALMVEETVAGFSLLAVDGQDGWIAGTSIDPDYRRKGLFAPLMRTQLDLARRLGIKQVYLECLSENHARKVYSSVGFVRLRHLHLYRGMLQEFRPTTQSLLPVTLSDYFEARRWAGFVPAWQRRESYLRRYPHLLALVNAEGTAGILAAGEQSTPVLDAWAMTARGAEEAISHIWRQNGGEVSLTNQPPDLVCALLSSKGMRPAAMQYEMRIDLG